MKSRSELACAFAIAPFAVAIEVSILWWFPPYAMQTVAAAEIHRVAVSAPRLPRVTDRVPVFTDMSTVYDCGDEQSRRMGLAAAASAVRSGQLVVFPTDTVYGIGCDAFDSLAVRSLLQAKGRTGAMPASVLVGSWSTLDGLVRTVPDAARQLVQAFWPGGLSIVLSAASSLAWDLGETRGTVMVRMPLHPVAIELLREVGPMAQSSANRSGHAPATDVANASDQLGDSVEVYLDGGPSGDPIPSTIVDLTGGDPVALREGAVRLDTVADVLGRDVELAR